MLADVYVIQIYICKLIAVNEINIWKLWIQWRFFVHPILHKDHGGSVTGYQLVAWPYSFLAFCSKVKWRKSDKVPF